MHFEKLSFTLHFFLFLSWPTTTAGLHTNYCPSFYVLCKNVENENEKNRDIHNAHKMTKMEKVIKPSLLLYALLLSLSTSNMKCFFWNLSLAIYSEHSTEAQQQLIFAHLIFVCLSCVLMAIVQIFFLYIFSFIWM